MAGQGRGGRAVMAFRVLALCMGTWPVLAADDFPPLADEAAAGAASPAADTGFPPAADAPPDEAVSPAESPVADAPHVAPEPVDEEDAPAAASPRRVRALEVLGTLAGLLACVPVAVLGAIIPGYLAAAGMAGWGGAMGAVGVGLLYGDPFSCIAAPYMALLGFGFSFVPFYGSIVQVMCAGPGAFLPFCSLSLLPLPLGSVAGGGLARWWLTGRNTREGLVGAFRRAVAAGTTYLPLAAFMATGACASSTCWGLGSSVWIASYAVGDSTSSEEADNRSTANQRLFDVAPFCFAGGTALAAGTLFMGAMGAGLSLLHVLEPMLGSSPAAVESNGTEPMET